MIIEIDAGCFTSAAIPSKDKSPLAVDADRVKSLQFAAQFLEVVARRHAQITVLGRTRGFENLPARCLPPKTQVPVRKETNWVRLARTEDIANLPSRMRAASLVLRKRVGGPHDPCGRSRDVRSDEDAATRAGRAGPPPRWPAGGKGSSVHFGWMLPSVTPKKCCAAQAVSSLMVRKGLRG